MEQRTASHNALLGERTFVSLCSFTKPPRNTVVAAVRSRRYCPKLPRFRCEVNRADKSETQQPKLSAEDERVRYGYLARRQRRPLVKVKFQVPHYPLPPGDLLRLVGGGSALGEWKVEDGPNLVWKPGDYWSVDLDLPPGMHFFKLVRVNGNGTVQWERGPNRTIEVPNSFSTSMYVTVSEVEPSTDGLDDSINDVQSMIQDLMQQRRSLRSKMAELETSLQERETRLTDLITTLDKVQAEPEPLWASMGPGIAQHLEDAPEPGAGEDTASPDMTYGTLDLDDNDDDVDEDLYAEDDALQTRSWLQGDAPPTASVDASVSGQSMSGGFFNQNFGSAGSSTSWPIPATAEVSTPIGRPESVSHSGPDSYYEEASAVTQEDDSRFDEYNRAIEEYTRAIEAYGRATAVDDDEVQSVGQTPPVDESVGLESDVDVDDALMSEQLEALLEAEDEAEAEAEVQTMAYEESEYSSWVTPDGRIDAGVIESVLAEAGQKLSAAQARLDMAQKKVLEIDQEAEMGTTSSWEVDFADEQATLEAVGVSRDSWVLESDMEKEALQADAGEDLGVGSASLWDVENVEDTPEAAVVSEDSWVLQSDQAKEALQAGADEELGVGSASSWEVEDVEYTSEAAIVPEDSWVLQSEQETASWATPQWEVISEPAVAPDTSWAQAVVDDSRWKQWDREPPTVQDNEPEASGGKVDSEFVGGEDASLEEIEPPVQERGPELFTIESPEAVEEVEESATVVREATSPVVEEAHKVEETKEEVVKETQIVNEEAHDVEEETTERLVGDAPPLAEAVRETVGWWEQAVAGRTTRVGASITLPVEDTANDVLDGGAAQFKGTVQEPVAEDVGVIVSEATAVASEKVADAGVMVGTEGAVVMEQLSDDAAKESDAVAVAGETVAAVELQEEGSIEKQEEELPVAEVEEGEPMAAPLAEDPSTIALEAASIEAEQPEEVEEVVSVAPATEEASVEAAQETEPEQVLLVSPAAEEASVEAAQQDEADQVTSVSPVVAEEPEVSPATIEAAVRSDDASIGDATPESDQALQQQAASDQAKLQEAASEESARKAAEQANREMEEAILSAITTPVMDPTVTRHPPSASEADVARRKWIVALKNTKQQPGAGAPANSSLQDAIVSYTKKQVENFLELYQTDLGNTVCDPQSDLTSFNPNLSPLSLPISGAFPAGLKPPGVPPAADSQKPSQPAPKKNINGQSVKKVFRTVPKVDSGATKRPTGLRATPPSGTVPVPGAVRQSGSKSRAGPPQPGQKSVAPVSGQTESPPVDLVPEGSEEALAAGGLTGGATGQAKEATPVPTADNSPEATSEAQRMVTQLGRSPQQGSGEGAAVRPTAVPMTLPSSLTVDAAENELSKMESVVRQTLAASMKLRQEFEEALKERGKDPRSASNPHTSGSDESLVPGARNNPLQMALPLQTDPVDGGSTSTRASGETVAQLLQLLTTAAQETAAAQAALSAVKQRESTMLKMERSMQSVVAVSEFLEQSTTRTGDAVSETEEGQETEGTTGAGNAAVGVQRSAADVAQQKGSTEGLGQASETVSVPQDDRAETGDTSQSVDELVELIQEVVQQIEAVDLTAAKPFGPGGGPGVPPSLKAKDDTGDSMAELLALMEEASRQVDSFQPIRPNGVQTQGGVGDRGSGTDPLAEMQEMNDILEQLLAAKETTDSMRSTLTREARALPNGQSFHGGAYGAAAGHAAEPRYPPGSTSSGDPAFDWLQNAASEPPYSGRSEGMEGMGGPVIDVEANQIFSGARGTYPELPQPVVDMEQMSVAEMLEQIEGILAWADNPSANPLVKYANQTPLRSFTEPAAMPKPLPLPSSSMSTLPSPSAPASAPARATAMASQVDQVLSKASQQLQELSAMFDEASSALDEINFDEPLMGDESPASGTTKDESLVSGTTKDESSASGTVVAESLASATTKDESSASGTTVAESLASGTIKDESSASGTVVAESSASGTTKDDVGAPVDLKEGIAVEEGTAEEGMVAAETDLPLQDDNTEHADRDDDNSKSSRDAASQLNEGLAATEHDTEEAQGRQKMAVESPAAGVAIQQQQETEPIISLADTDQEKQKQEDVEKQKQAPELVAEEQPSVVQASAAAAEDSTATKMASWTAVSMYSESAVSLEALIPLEGAVTGQSGTKLNVAKAPQSSTASTAGATPGQTAVEPGQTAMETGQTAARGQAAVEPGQMAMETSQSAEEEKAAGNGLLDSNPAVEKQPEPSPVDDKAIVDDKAEDLNSGKQQLAQGNAVQEEAAAPPPEVVGSTAEAAEVVLGIDKVIRATDAPMSDIDALSQGPQGLSEIDAAIGEVLASDVTVGEIWDEWMKSFAGTMRSSVPATASVIMQSPANKPTADGMSSTVVEGRQPAGVEDAEQLPEASVKSTEVAQPRNEGVLDTVVAAEFKGMPENGAQQGAAGASQVQEQAGSGMKPGDNVLDNVLQQQQRGAEGSVLDAIHGAGLEGAKSDGMKQGGNAAEAESAPGGGLSFEDLRAVAKRMLEEAAAAAAAEQLPRNATEPDPVPQSLHNAIPFEDLRAVAKRMLEEAAAAAAAEQLLSNATEPNPVPQSLRNAMELATTGNGSTAARSRAPEAARQVKSHDLPVILGLEQYVMDQVRGFDSSQADQMSVIDRVAGKGGAGSDFKVPAGGAYGRDPGSGQSLRRGAPLPSGSRSTFDAVLSELTGQGTGGSNTAVEGIDELLGRAPGTGKSQDQNAAPAPPSPPPPSALSSTKAATQPTPQPSEPPQQYGAPVTPSPAVQQVSQCPPAAEKAPEAVPAVPQSAMGTPVGAADSSGDLEGDDKGAGGDAGDVASVGKDPAPPTVKSSVTLSAIGTVKAKRPKAKGKVPASRQASSVVGSGSSNPWLEGGQKLMSLVAAGVAARIRKLGVDAAQGAGPGDGISLDDEMEEQDNQVEETKAPAVQKPDNLKAAQPAEGGKVEQTPTKQVAPPQKPTNSVVVDAAAQAQTTAKTAASAGSPEMGDEFMLDNLITNSRTPPLPPPDAVPPITAQKAAAEILQAASEYMGRSPTTRPGTNGGAWDTPMTGWKGARDVDWSWYAEDNVLDAVLEAAGRATMELEVGTGTLRENEQQQQQQVQPEIQPGIQPEGVTQQDEQQDNLEDEVVSEAKTLEQMAMHAHFTGVAVATVVWLAWRSSRQLLYEPIREQLKDKRERAVADFVATLTFLVLLSKSLR